MKLKCNTKPSSPLALPQAGPRLTFPPGRRFARFQNSRAYRIAGRAWQMNAVATPSQGQARPFASDNKNIPQTQNKAN
ncbi:MAG: hypothetical protein GXP03_06870 [Alphaproteobacteria bacterium]|nr:hypothetical protein [Alphaproteobacteria bacterium]